MKGYGRFISVGLLLVCALVLSVGVASAQVPTPPAMIDSDAVIGEVWPVVAGLVGMVSGFIALAIGLKLFPRFVRMIKGTGSR